MERRNECCWSLTWGEATPPCLVSTEVIQSADACVLVNKCEAEKTRGAVLCVFGFCGSILWRRLSLTLEFQFQQAFFLYLLKPIDLLTFSDNAIGKRRFCTQPDYYTPIISSGVNVSVISQEKERPDRVFKHRRPILRPYILKPAHLFP